MTRSLKEIWVWMGGFAYLFASFFILIKFNGYYLQLITASTVAGCGILFYAVGIRQSFHILLLSLPLSLNLPIAGQSQIMFPSELLVSAIGISVILLWIKNSGEFIEWLRQPLTIAIACYLIVTLISVFFSEMMVVSVKSAIIKILYVIAFYGGGYLYFRDTGNKGKGIVWYLIPLLLVIAVVLFRHAQFSFSNEVSGYVTKPFYQDHTIYSAVLAFVIPLVIALAIKAESLKRTGYILIALFLMAALFFASSRAAWLSLIIAALTGLLIAIKFPRQVFVFMMLLSSLFVFFKSDDLIWRLKSNRFDSSARNAGIEEQTKSVTNITNDQSNAERINRWKCACRMFQEKPLTGFGPGTYQFSYFPFQREKEMTRISVKSPYNIADGRGGTAHNEFLLILAESGLAAAFCFLLLVMMTFYFALRSCYSGELNITALTMLMAFITFIVHSLFNNFLDTDKTAILFYMSIAFFASLRYSETKNVGYEG